MQIIISKTKSAIPQIKDVWALTPENRSSGFPTRSDSNGYVQSQKQARSLTFRIEEGEKLYYRCSENKGVDPLRSNCVADLHLCFRIGKNPVFSCSDSSVIMTLFQAPFGRNSLKLIVEGDDNVQNYFNLDLTNGNVTVRQSLVQQSEPYYKVYNIPLGETLDSVSTVFNEIAQHPPHTLFAVCNWSIGHPRWVLGTLSPRQVVHNISVAR